MSLKTNATGLDLLAFAASIHSQTNETRFYLDRPLRGLATASSRSECLINVSSQQPHNPNITMILNNNSIYVVHLNTFYIFFFEQQNNGPAQ